MNEIKYYKKIFISPGIVDFKDVGDGILLIQKEVIDDAIKTLVGKPVIITHEGTEEVGEVVDAYYSIESGGFICGFIIKTKEAINLLDNQEYSISCTYDITEYGDGGVYHNINYEEEAKAINFKNIAIVKNPRYQETKIKINSINNNEQETMKLFNKKNETEKDEKQNAEENFITFKGEKISLEELGRVLIEEVAFHKGKPVNDKTEITEEKSTADEKANKKNEKLNEDEEDKNKEEKQNEQIDKRKEIDDVGGFLKSKGLSDEDIKIVMAKMEKDAYDSSEKGNKANSCKNNKDEETDEEGEQKQAAEKEIKKSVKENSLRPIQNAIKNALFFEVPEKPVYSKKERIEISNKKYSINK